MGCTSAKQVSAVPNGEEGQNKAYSNGDLLSGQSAHFYLFRLYPTFVHILEFEMLDTICHCYSLLMSKFICDSIPGFSQIRSH